MNVMLSKTFFPQHPLAGDPTHFAEKVAAGAKIHTIRRNYDYWEKRIKQLKERGGTLSLRQWSAKPYQKGSTQLLISDLPAEKVGVELLVLSRSREITSYYEDGSKEPLASAESYTFSARVNEGEITLEDLARGDGLSPQDFKDWFNPVFDELEKTNFLINIEGREIRPTIVSARFAIIHFTPFRYGRARLL